MMWVQMQNGAAMPINELGSFDKARKPGKTPGPQRVIAHPVVPEPEDMCPHKRKVLDAALSDSYSGGWVHGLITPPPDKPK